MTPELPDDAYLGWLYSQVASVHLKNPSRTYWSLFRCLYTTEFVWFVPNDDNRVEDGRALRYQFIEETGTEVDPEWLHLGCSMIDLKNFVQEKGFTVAHIKTDSIKIPNATPEIIKEVYDFGKKYGYTFEHEATYSKFCLVNDAVYIAKVGWAEKEKKIGKWEAVGAQFQHPYVYKTLFSQEIVEPDDYYEPKQVQKGAMHLDFESVQNPIYGVQGMQFIGRTGLFLPVKPESGGGILYRIFEGKKYAVTGTKGYFWLEAEMAKSLGDAVQIDMDHLAQAHKEKTSTPQ